MTFVAQTSCRPQFLPNVLLSNHVAQTSVAKMVSRPNVHRPLRWAIYFSFPFPVVFFCSFFTVVPWYTALFLCFCRILASPSEVSQRGRSTSVAQISSNGMVVRSWSYPVSESCFWVLKVTDSSRGLFVDRSCVYTVDNDELHGWMNRPRRPGYRIEGLMGIATSSFRMRYIRISLALVLLLARGSHCRLRIILLKAMSLLGCWF